MTVVFCHSSASIRAPLTMVRAWGAQSKWTASTPSGRPLAFAAGANGCGVGRDLGVVERVAQADVGDGVVVAGRQRRGARKPRFARDVEALDGVALGAAVGDDAPVQIAQPQIEIDGVGAEDHAEPLRRVGAVRVGRVRRAVDDRAVGRPPAHVAGSLIEIAVDDLDGVEREVDQPARRPRHPPCLRSRG